MGSVESEQEAQHQDPTGLGTHVKVKRETPLQEQKERLTPDDSALAAKPVLPLFTRSDNPNVERLREAVYVRYLFEDFVLSPTRDTKLGWLALLLPKLYTEAENEATLKLAVRAAAYAYMGNRRQAPELQLEAGEMYGQCLKVLALDLRSLEIATSNQTATAVLVLGLYECIAGNGSESFWHSHGQGLSLLMQLRNSQMSQDPTSLPKEETPDGMIICQMQRRNLDLRKQPSPEEGTYIKNLDSTSPANRMFGAAFQCSHVVARAHEEVLKADGGAASVARLEKVVTDIQIFDTALQRLFRTCQTLSPTDKYRTDAELQAQWLATCPTYRAMAMWIFLKASRITLHEILIECLELLQTSDDDVSEALAVMRQSADAIFSTVGFMTEAPNESLRSLTCRGPKNSGGYYLLWPLHVIVACKCTDHGQKQMARDVLLKIGSEMGLNHALEIARVVE